MTDRELLEATSPEGGGAQRLTVSQVDTRMKRGCYLLVGKFQIPVKILAHKFEMGHNRFLVTPVGGRGEMWKNEEKLKFA